MYIIYFFIQYNNLIYICFIINIINNDVICNIINNDVVTHPRMMAHKRNAALPGRAENLQGRNPIILGQHAGVGTTRTTVYALPPQDHVYGIAVAHDPLENAANGTRLPTQWSTIGQPLCSHTAQVCPSWTTCA